MRVPYYIGDLNRDPNLENYPLVTCHKQNIRLFTSPFNGLKFIPSLRPCYFKAYSLINALVELKYIPSLRSYYNLRHIPSV